MANSFTGVHIKGLKILFTDADTFVRHARGL